MIIYLLFFFMQFIIPVITFFIFIEFISIKDSSTRLRLHKTIKITLVYGFILILYDVLSGLETTISYCKDGSDPFFYFYIKLIPVLILFILFFVSKQRLITK